MNITISGKDFKLTPAIKVYVEEKIGKLSRFSRRIIRIGVELDVDHNVTKGMKNRIEVWIYLPGKTIQAGLKAEHMREAIDLVYPKLERQLVAYEGKKRERRRPGKE